MNKFQQAVARGFVIAAFVVGILTIFWAIYLHFFPNTWIWVKNIMTFFNYSFGLYIGMLSSSLQTKARGINATLYVMLLFFLANIILRVTFVGWNMIIWLVIVKLIYSLALLTFTFRHAKTIQGNQKVPAYSRLG